MKSKLLILVLSFVIAFNTSVVSYADNNDIYINNNSKTVVAPLVIAPEVYSIIMGALAMGGIALNLDDSITFMSRLYEKVDSGVFSAYPTYKKLEEEIIKNTKKEQDPNDPKKSFFILSDNMFKDLISIFDSTIKDNGDNTITMNSNPFSDLNTYISTQSETIVKNVECGDYYHLRTMSDLVFKPSYDENNNLRFDVDVYKAGTSDLLFTCVYKFYSYSKRYIGFSIWDNPNTSDNRYNLLNYNYLDSNDVKQSHSAYSGKIFITYPSNTYKYNGSFSSSNIKNKFSNIDDLPSNDNIGFLPPSINGGSNTPNSTLDPPKFSELEGFNFEGLNINLLGDAFSNFKNKFPFSLPFDLVNLIDGFVSDPIAPIFEVDIMGNPLVLDLTDFNELANIIRMFVSLGYVVSLMFISKRFGG